MDSVLTGYPDAKSDPFSETDYLAMLEQLDLDAKKAAAKLGFSWNTNMKRKPDQHTLARQALTILRAGLFDESFYIATYPDVLSSGIQPLLHYVSFGDAEGRKPNPVFDPNFYRTQFGKTGLHSVCALYHYAVLGEPLGLKPSGAFDPYRYLVSNAGLHPWVDKPLTHYLKLGRQNGLIFSHRSRLPASQKMQYEKIRPPALPLSVNPADGVNVVGPLEKVSGLGVSVRGYLEGLKMAGVTRIGSRSPQREFAIQQNIKNNSTLPPLMADAAINVIHMNGDTLPIMLADGGDVLFQGKYNVAIWYWELPALRPEWYGSMKYFHEFWAPTPFIANALRQSTGKPVRLVPPYLSYLHGLKAVQRPGSATSNFVYCFDANSILERKNPSALLNAFLRAFPMGHAGPQAQLSFKITYPNRKIAEVDLLYRAAEQDHRIKIIDHLMSDTDLHALIGSATAYVSPHRSEGLGLTVIEAMGAGVPVIATPFGGVDAFVTPETAFPIDYQHTELAGDYVPYPEGFVWADPDVESLALQLQKVHLDKEEARKRAAAARSKVLEFFASPELIEVYRRELVRISQIPIASVTPAA